MPGTYTLAIALAGTASIEVGALGRLEFRAGRYAYTGSAFGPGGFARVDRHRATARGDHDVRHWHVDYLLGHPVSSVTDVVRTEGADVECPVARALAERGDPVPDFGCSDCDCPSHLVFSPDADALDRAIRAAHRDVRAQA